jgi:hypothetical protein
MAIQQPMLPFDAAGANSVTVGERKVCTAWVHWGVVTADAGDAGSAAKIPNERAAAPAAAANLRTAMVPPPCDCYGLTSVTPHADRSG